MPLLTLLLLAIFWPSLASGLTVREVQRSRTELDTLKFVHVVWRHGDRTPSKMMPSDTVNTLEKWKAKFGGLGQLTADGARQHWHFGRMLRHRYGGQPQYGHGHPPFLADHFSPDEFVYRTSDFNRTKMSAIANLQGMFPRMYKSADPTMPLEDNRPKGLEFNFLPQGHDPIVFDEVECKAASRAEDELFNSTDFKQEEKNNEPILRLLGEKAGYGQVPHPLRRIYYIHDPLTSIRAHEKDGFVMPEWVNESLRQEIFRLYNLKNSFNYKVDVIKRLWAGPLFTEILNRMDTMVRDGYKGKEKFHAYSGHDGTIAGLLSIFGIFPEVFPTYANAVILELHQTGDDEPYIRLFHKNYTDSSADELRLYEYEELPECGTPCTLRKLRETCHAFLIDLDRWERECRAEKDPEWTGCGSLSATPKAMGCPDDCYLRAETCFFRLGRRYLCCST